MTIFFFLKQGLLGYVYLMGTDFIHSHTILKQWLGKVKWNANAMKFRHFYVWHICLKTFGATVYVTVVNESMSANRNLKNAWCNKITLQWNISRWSISVVYVCGCDCTTCWYLSKQSILRHLSGFGLQTEALFGSVVAICDMTRPEGQRKYVS